MPGAGGAKTKVFSNKVLVSCALTITQDKRAHREKELVGSGFASAARGESLGHLSNAEDLEALGKEGIHLFGSWKDKGLRASHLKGHDLAGSRLSLFRSRGPGDVQELML